MKFREVFVTLFFVSVLSYVIFLVMSDIYNTDYGFGVAIVFLVAATAAIAISVRREDR